MLRASVGNGREMVQRECEWRAGTASRIEECDVSHGRAAPSVVDVAVEGSII